MATQTLTSTASEQDETVKMKIQQLRKQFADAPELGRTALENVLRELTSQVSQTLAQPVASAGRIGIRQGMDGHDISSGATAAGPYTKPLAGPCQRDFRIGAVVYCNADPVASRRRTPTIANGLDSMVTQTAQLAHRGAAPSGVTGILHTLGALVARDRFNNARTCRSKNSTHRLWSVRTSENALDLDLRDQPQTLGSTLAEQRCAQP